MNKLYRNTITYNVDDILKQFVDLAGMRFEEARHMGVNLHTLAGITPQLSLGRRAGHTTAIFNPDNYSGSLPLVVTALNSMEIRRMFGGRVNNAANLFKESTEYFSHTTVAGLEDAISQGTLRGFRGNVRPIIFDSISERGFINILSEVGMDIVVSEVPYILRVG